MTQRRIGSIQQAGIKGSHVGEYLDTRHSAPSDGGSAQLTFYGSNSSVYGAFNGKYDLDTPIAYINVDNEPQHTIIPRNINDQLLGRDVALRRPIISSPSWFIDYAIYVPYPTTPTATSPPTGTSRSSTATPTPTDTSTPPPSSSQNSGAIAGGMVGTLAGFTLIIAAILLWRRKNRTRSRPITAVQEEYPASIDQPLPYALEVSHDSPSTPSAWNEGSYESKGAERVASSGTGSSHGARSSTAASSGVENTQSPVGGGSGSATGTPTQEVDGGVRLATSSTYGSEVLPSTYVPYDRA